MCRARSIQRQLFIFNDFLMWNRVNKTTTYLPSEQQTKTANESSRGCSSQQLDRLLDGWFVVVRSVDLFTIGRRRRANVAVHLHQAAH